MNNNQPFLQQPSLIFYSRLSDILIPLSTVQASEEKAIKGSLALNIAKLVLYASWLLNCFVDFMKN